MKDQINTIREALNLALTWHDAKYEHPFIKQALTALSNLESHLAQYGAGDMASAAAQGVRDGVASVAQPQQPVAYYYQKHNCFGQLLWNVGFVAPRDATYCYPLYTAAPVAQQPQATCKTCGRRMDDPSVIHGPNGCCPAQQPQAAAVPTVQIVNCDTCKHSANSCDDYPCNRCGVEFGDGPFNRWEAPQQAEAVPPDVEVIRKALERAFIMGQNYWADADSESYSANKRSDVTRQKFNAMRDEVCAAIAQQKGQP